MIAFTPKKTKGTKGTWIEEDQKFPFIKPGDTILIEGNCEGPPAQRTVFKNVEATFINGRLSKLTLIDGTVMVVE